MTIRGLHHVTAFTESLDRNLSFYRELLGLRLVKRTVAYDDPYTHHLYYGDATGAPGTVVTFSPWSDDEDVEQPVGGTVTTLSFAVPPTSLGYWTDRLAAHGVETERTERFDRSVLSFTDPDGLPLELVAADVPGDPWDGEGVPTKYAVRGLFGVTLAVPDAEETGTFLEDSFGYVLVGEDDERLRYRSEARVGAVIDVLRAPPEEAVPVGPGHVHHAAFRVESAADQTNASDAISALGMNVSPVLNRQYFRSMYFREPGGTVFELATDTPGFDVDEDPEALGTELMLPEWLEDRRDDIEAHLPPLLAADEGDGEGESAGAD
ncbi:ring-cleaving dioxygenase [Halomarina ordinaria]|uniref:Ring-cleaving dioxygenase n=1 Tax=Halomarina ordinaria TaxID=3033939 RepID=A0ABD5UE52_9EURY|nr:ring-cleaving dioxygenase [Halomarina sp. PSRA2]